MHPLRSAALGALLCAALAGSAIAAAPTADQAAQFKVGEATIADVTAVLGKPQSVSLIGGKTMVSYSTTHTSVKATTFIPLVGLFAGGGSSKTSAAMFIFDETGKLVSSSLTNASADCSTSIVGASCK